MFFDELLIVHPIELVAGEYQCKINIGLVKKTEVLPNGIGSTLIPVHTFYGLGCCQNFNKTPGEIIEFISPGYMPVKRCGVKLCEYVNLIKIRIQAVTDRNVNESIFSRKRDGRF